MQPSPKSTTTAATEIFDAGVEDILQQTAAEMDVGDATTPAFNWSLDPDPAWLLDAAAAGPSNFMIGNSSPQAAISSSIPLDDLGINHFINSYVDYGSEASPGFFGYAIPMLALEEDSKIIAPAMRAVGLAGLANLDTSRKNELMRNSRSSYAEAIDLVNQAVASTDGAAQRDATIVSVLILGLYESNTCSSNTSLDAWAGHVDGAAALLASRGVAQFRTSSGMRIFFDALSLLMARCAQAGIALPPRIRLLRAQAARFTDVSDPAWIMAGAFIDVMEIHRRVDPDNSKSPLRPDEWEQCLAQTVVVDRELASRFDFSQLPAKWLFKTISDPLGDSQIIYQNTYHIYPDTGVAKIWNGMRACRLIANTVILSILRRDAVAAGETLASGQYSDLCQQAGEIVGQMRTDILASAPQLMGHVSYPSLCLVTQDRGDLCPLPPANSWFTMWYLYLVGAASADSPESRSWVANQLRGIREVTGIEKASYFSDLVESQGSSSFSPVF